MLTFDTLPQARVVRTAGQLMAPPPTPPEPRGPIAESVRTFFVYAIGLWPLTAIVMVAFGLLLYAGHGSWR